MQRTGAPRQGSASKTLLAPALKRYPPLLPARTLQQPSRDLTKAPFGLSGHWGARLQLACERVYEGKTLTLSAVDGVRVRVDFGTHRLPVRT